MKIADDLSSGRYEIAERSHATSAGVGVNEVRPATPEMVLTDSLNPIGLEHFDEMVSAVAVAAKKAGAKSVKINCVFCGEIIF